VRRVVLLDAAPLGWLSHPRKHPDIKVWVQKIMRAGYMVRVPEIADYEIRRELLRAGKTAGIQRLNLLKSTLGYIPITTETMLRAAEFWAQARQQGLPTADDRALDGDVILAAQAAEIAELGYEAIVATSNIKHLSRFVVAQNWEDIG
jgi:predicted nucleic acid-binding protein